MVIYGAETWAIYKSDLKKALVTFERKILKKIFGPVLDNQWRIRKNVEFEKLYITLIKFQHLIWLGHLQRTEDVRNTKKIHQAT